MSSPGDLPLVSVGIPTYNRAGFLRESLASALAQSYPHVEVIVSDNASADDTPRVVEELGAGRVRYHRNAANLGSPANFLRALELARGEFFAWLQDDDLLQRDFVRRGVEALQAAPAAVAYFAFSLSTPDPGSVNQPFLYGPAYPLDWAGGRAQQFPGSVITPLSLFLTMSMPPTTLYRTEHLRRHADAFLDARTPLLNERTLLAQLTSDRTVVADPYVGGIFREHSGQESYLYQQDRQALGSQWLIMVEKLQQIRDAQADRHDELLADILGRFADRFIVNYYRQVTLAPRQNGLLQSVAEVLRRVAAGRGLHLDEPDAVPQPAAGWAKEAARVCTPPVVWAALRRLVGRQPATE